jgi:hypothetical protein
MENPRDSLTTLRERSNLGIQGVFAGIAQEPHPGREKTCPFREVTVPISEFPHMQTPASDACGVTSILL